MNIATGFSPGHGHTRFSGNGAGGTERGRVVGHEHLAWPDPFCILQQRLRVKGRLDPHVMTLMSTSLSVLRHSQ